MAKKYYTVMVVSDEASQVRRYKLPKMLLTYVVVAACVFFTAATFIGVEYIALLDAARENKALHASNFTLTTRVQSLHERISAMSATVERVGRFEKRLRSITRLSDPERNLAMGPLSVPSAGATEVRLAKGESQDRTTEPVDSELALSLLQEQVDSMEQKSINGEKSLQQLAQHFQKTPRLFASTPSIWPLRGWVTADFGMRTDPYTSDRSMHNGIDIAAPLGEAIKAPGDGSVIFVGHRDRYGKTLVLAHGFGVQTHYSHLSKVSCRLGERVQRGDAIAEVGNTGRSLGPHLHYEVHVDGIPQNPRKYLLDIKSEERARP